MINTITPHGKGRIRTAVNYVLGKRDANGKLRAAVQVLRGDPDMVSQVGETLTFKYKYTSGVIAWHKDDQPTKQQINEVLNSFEEAFFAGLEKDRFSWLAVLHQDEDGGCHIHILINKVDLRTGKNFNPAAPGWMQLFDPLRNHFNYKYQWARPDDPARTRYLQSGNMALVLKKTRNEKVTHAHIKQQVHGELMKRYMQGRIKNREDVITEVKSLGFSINRAGKNYISIKNEKTGIKIRFKGKLYNDKLNTNELNRALSESQGNNADRQSNTREDDEQKVKDYYKEYRERLSKKAKDNVKRYNKAIKRNTELKYSIPRKIQNNNIYSQFDSNDLIFDRGLPITIRTQSIDGISIYKRDDSTGVHDGAIRRRDSSFRRRGIHATSIAKAGSSDVWEKNSNKIEQLVSKYYESTANRIIERIRKFVGAICEGTKRNERTNRAIESASGGIDECISGVETDIGKAKLIIGYRRNKDKKFKSAMSVQKLN